MPRRGKFLGYYIRIIDRIHIQSSLAFLIVFSRVGRGEIPHPHPGKKFGTFLKGISPSLEKKENTTKQYQKLASLVKFFLLKLASLAKSLSATGSLRSPKTVCARLAAALSSHTCVCGVPVNFTIAHRVYRGVQIVDFFRQFFSPKTRFPRQKFVCKRLAARCLRAHVCAVRRLSSSS